MELVRGVRITDYCDEAELTTPQRLGLFAQVCQAVQHAHQKGIIHRDLKPSNILVTINDGEAVPKVIDFGIAKATAGQELTDKSVYTAFEQFIGTPAYMSPEQALMTSLDIDTRSDVYSLGVLFYELLTGRPPFDPKTLMAAGIDSMRRTLREEEPMRPSTVAARELSTLGAGGGAPPASADSPQGDPAQGARNRTRRQVRLQEAIPLLRGDLDWIVMKCLEKDRRRRYDTAAGLAADIRRHLDNEPVTARPPTLGYRVHKTLRRHRSAVATAGVVLVALLLGLGFSAWQAVQKSQALARMTEAERAQSRSRERPAPQPLKVAIHEETVDYRLSVDNRTLLVASKNGAVTQRHGPALESETPLFHLGRSLGKPVFSEDGRWFAAGSTGGFVEIWDVLERRQVQKIGSYTGAVRAVQFSPDGTRLIVLDSANERFAEWDLAASRELRAFPTFHRKDDLERGAVLARDGQQMLRLDRKGGVLWMDTQSREERGLGPVPSTVGGMVIAPDGLRFAVRGRDEFTRVLDRRTFETIATLGDGKPYQRSMQFMEGGNRMVLGGNWDPSPVALWDVATGLELVHLGTGGVCRRLDVSADGNVVVAGIAGKLFTPVKELQLWRAPSWEEIERAEAALPDVSSVRPR